MCGLFLLEIPVTISTDAASKTFLGNGITVGFPCEFRIFSDTDVSVSIVDPVAGTNVPLVLDTDYTISGAGDQSGFTLSTAVPVPAGKNLLVSRDIAIEQPTDFTNQGAFFPTMHEDTADRTVMQVQQLAHQISLALRIPDGLSPQPRGVLPYPSPGSLLGWAEDGSGIVNTGASGVGAGSIIDVNVANNAGISATKLAFLQQGTGALSRPVQDKLREQAVSIVDFGANTAFADNQGQVNAAIVSAGLKGRVQVPNGNFTMLADPVNKYGVEFGGQGRIMRPDIYGGAEQYNTYRNTKPIAYGKEYFWPVYNVIQNTHVPIQCYCYGDSTVQGGFNFIDGPFFLEQLLPSAVSAKGVRNYFNVTNRGVGGSNLSTWNPTPDIGVNSANPAHLVILKSGINDASFPFATRIDTFRDNLRNGLQAIRNVSGGDVATTAILLVGPNPTIDKDFHSRNAEWYEEIRGIYEAAARDFKCAYFDTYQYLKDVEWARGTWINDDSAPGGNPVSLHPRNVGQSWIWGAIVDFIFGQTEIFRWKTNNFHNRSVYFGFPNAKPPPTWYPSNYDNGMTIEVASTADGYPGNGILVTTKSTEGPLRQVLMPLDESGYVASRTSSVSSGFYGEWKGVPKNLTLLNSWTAFGAPYATPKATAGDDGIISLNGMIRPGTTTANTVLFVLPADMRPTKQHIVPAISDAGICQVEIFANGNVTLRSGTPGSYLSLSGICFMFNS